MMVGSTFSYSNVHKVLDDNSKYYREYGYGCKRINQGYASECSIINKEPNANATRFFELIKDFDEPLWDWCINHNILSVVAYCTTLKMHIWPSAKPMSMLRINPESDGERLLSHIENWDTS